MSEKKVNVKKRDQRFANRTVTKIWYEEPSPENPYLAQKSLCHGYDILELAQKRSFVEVLFLLFQGELPSIEQKEILETLMVALINPGPRHPATRAAMNAGVGKTNTVHILPISLSVLGGAWGGGEEVENCMRFLRTSAKKSPKDVAGELIKILDTERDGDVRIAPGFGSLFGGIDPMTKKVASMLVEMEGAGATMKWAREFIEAIDEVNCGWLSTGIAAAVFVDLGVLPFAGAGLFQLICAPGLLAHGIELANPFKFITAMPFLDDEHFIIQDEARKK